MAEMLVISSQKLAVLLAICCILISWCHLEWKTQRLFYAHTYPIPLQPTQHGTVREYEGYNKLNLEKKTYLVMSHNEDIAM